VLDLLIRAEVLPGQAVVVEDPTFPGPLDTLQRAGARMVGVPATDGTDPGRLAQAVATHQPALVYLTLTHHNPTGLVMPGHHRRQIAELAAAHPDTLFIDDLTMADLTLDDIDVPPPLAALAPGLPNIVTVGSLSKSCWGGLRTGWARAEAGVVSRLAAAKAAADLGSPLYQQAIAAALVRDQHAEIVRWQRDQLRVQRDVLTGALRSLLPSWDWRDPPGGVALWVRLPGDPAGGVGGSAGAGGVAGAAGAADSGAFAQAALRHGVAVVPGRLLSASGLSRDYLRIAYNQPPDQLRAAAVALAAAWENLPRASG
jgi:DNA-binding transcriptional MocR family regulator